MRPDLLTAAIVGATWRVARGGEEMLAEVQINHARADQKRNETRRRRPGLWCIKFLALRSWNFCVAAAARDRRVGQMETSVRSSPLLWPFAAIACETQHPMHRSSTGLASVAPFESICQLDTRVMRTAQIQDLPCS